MRKGCDGEVEVVEVEYNSENSSSLSWASHLPERQPNGTPTAPANRGPDSKR